MNLRLFELRPLCRDSGSVTDSDCEPAEMDGQTGGASDGRQSVSELVRNYSDPPPSESQKRNRSESGDPAPAGKRGAGERAGGLSPSAAGSRNFKETMVVAMDDLEERIMAALSRELHEFRDIFMAEISKVNTRLKDLEQHVEERDIAIADLTDELRQSRSQVTELQHRVEEAEMNSRLPCIILSGAAMAPRNAPRLEPPLPTQAADRPAPGAVSADPGQGHSVTSRPAERQASEDERRPTESAPVDGGARGVTRGRSVTRGDRGGEEREDINALVVTTLNRCMPGLNIAVNDIDRAHRLPGPNNRVIVRFVRSGQGSVRDEVMARRLELRGRDLFVNESLTKLRSHIFRSLLAVKREKKIYTVYSRGGNVFFKEKQHGVSTRVDSLRRLHELGYRALER